MKNKVKTNFKEFLRNFIDVLKRPEMTILPGQLAFFFVLCIVPTITIISYVAAWVNISTDIIFEFIGTAFSPEIADMLLATTNLDLKGLPFIITILVGYFFASNGSASIIITSNTIYGEQQTSFLRRRVKAIVMTFFLIVLFVFMLTVPVFGDKIVDMFKYVNMDQTVTDNVVNIFKILQGPITWFIIYFFIKIIYTMAPNRTIKSKSVGYGALFTSISWVIITYIYSFYTNHIAHYSTFYGGLANIVILMVWFYFLAYAFTIGIALNYHKEEIDLEKTGTIKIDN